MVTKVGAQRGVASGVPFVAVPPETGAGADRVVVAWHLLDPPRTESAMASALPLEGLDAWRIYLGLPMSGSRLPAGGFDELMRLGFEDGVLNIQAPVIDGAVAEFSEAYATIRRRLGIGNGPIGVLGGSAGAAAALRVMAETDVEVAAAVLVSPLVRLASVVEAMERRFGAPYAWSDASRAVAERLDLVVRAHEIAARQPRAAFLLVVGADDDEAGFRAPASELHDALAASTNAELVVVPGMEHALAEEPGIDPAPQTPHAAVVDARTVDWFRRHLER